MIRAHRRSALPVSHFDKGRQRRRAHNSEQVVDPSRIVSSPSGQRPCHLRSVQNAELSISAIRYLRDSARLFSIAGRYAELPQSANLGIVARSDNHCQDISWRGPEGGNLSPATGFAKSKFGVAAYFPLSVCHGRETCEDAITEAKPDHCASRNHVPEAGPRAGLDRRPEDSPSSRPHILFRLRLRASPASGLPIKDQGLSLGSRTETGRWIVRIVSDDFTRQSDVDRQVNRYCRSRL